ncbi:MAG TPA: glycerophosphodiester phosphodiesterase family protein [Mariprofundaceae bacterium]|nr:glycerophosphodiester phosphodiesterase family protein [Mariprofundaceae bacterium]
MPALIAHRGYPRRYPENTLSGFTAAIGRGARHIEMDVQLSADGVPVVFHDDDVQRLCGVPGRITDMLLAEVRQLRVGGEPVPTMAEFARLLQAHADLHAFVELKQESIDVAGEAAMLAAVTEDLEPVRARCTLISFNAGILRLAAARGWDAGWVTEDWPDALPEGMRVWFCDVRALPSAGPVNPFAVPLAVYAVSDAALAHRLAGRGAAYIETDDIAGMRRALPGWA